MGKEFSIYDFQKGERNNSHNYDTVTEYVKDNVVKISSSFFTLELSSYIQRIYHDVILDWNMVGWCNAEDLEFLSKKNEIAIMYENKDGAKVWFHTYDNW